MTSAQRIRDELKDALPHTSFVRNRSIAVLLPCYNEEATIAAVIAGFRKALPGAQIYVYDNNSTDRTSEIALAEKAIVRHEPFQGKGNVVRRMLADIDADIFVMADGDLTYDASAAGQMVDLLVSRNLDMVVGTRIAEEDEAFRLGHRFGNRLFNGIVGRLFGPNFTDILSGYRVISRRFAKSFPAASKGFEIETEFSVHAIDLRLATAEVPLHYGKRPELSVSKLKTYRDGTRILYKIAMMYRALKPIRFYGLIACGFFALSGLLGAPIVVEFVHTGLVPRLPTAILAASLAQLGFMALACGVIIDAVSAQAREVRRMRYLGLMAPGETPPGSHARRAGDPDTRLAATS
jgi:glycosyltransferase involved in cell wall biosynthesis